jgi:hydroxyacylglutathione hydrolase
MAAKTLVEFTREQITPAVSRIRGAGNVCMYFVEGSRHGALIDTGYGVGDLKGYIESITDKPYDVLITHGHLDHAGGAGQFGRVYMNYADRALFREHCKVETRKNALRSTCPELFDEFIPRYESDFIPLDDGQNFDLGGINVEAIQIPGHTQGIMVFLDVEERVAMFGDACGVGVLLMLPESSSVSEYRKSLIAFQEKHEARYDAVLRQHGTCESSCHVLEDVIEACGRVMDGTDDAVPSECMGRMFFRASAFDPESGKRLDGREGNIVYSKDKIF